MLYDPFLMKDMEQAVERLQLALKTGKRFWCMVIMMWTVPPPWP